MATFFPLFWPQRRAGEAPLGASYASFVPASQAFFFSTGISGRNSFFFFEPSPAFDPGEALLSSERESFRLFF